MSEKKNVLERDEEFLTGWDKETEHYKQRADSAEAKLKAVVGEVEKIKALSSICNWTTYVSEMQKHEHWKEAWNRHSKIYYKISKDIFTIADDKIDYVHPDTLKLKEVVGYCNMKNDTYEKRGGDWHE